jgi:antitoxin component of MazEF toxin-antitoxin module
MWYRPTMSDDVLPAQTAVARLRPKNQLTLPEAVLSELDVAVGTRFLISVEGGAIRLEPVLASYAGALAEVYPADWTERLRREREAWQD